MSEGKSPCETETCSSLTIHVCFLRETVFVGTNNPNMEETGSLENPISFGKCYLDLNRAGMGVGEEIGADMVAALSA